jgi:hypothetical protein
MAGTPSSRSPAAASAARATPTRRAIRSGWEESRWRHLVDGSWLAVRLLPVVAVAVLGKLVLNLLGVEPLEANALLSGLVAANVFLLGFMLAGTLADFKEAERLPGDLAASLDSIADECLIIHAAKGQHPVAAACIRHLRDLARGIERWMAGTYRHDEVLADIRNLNHFFRILSPFSEVGFIVRIKAEQRAVAGIVLRMDSIRLTSFVTAGYLIAQIATWLVLLSLVLTDAGPIGQELFFVAVIAFVLIYMNRLIRDLDNPFEYRLGVRGAADVSLLQLQRAERRLDRLLTSLGEQPAAGAADEGDLTLPARPTTSA